MTISRYIGAAAASLIIAGAAISPLLAAPPAANGETLFRQRCQVCHSVDVTKPAGVGPNLRGVVGRKAAAVTSFNYSTAMKQSNITWTQANLDRYLAAPTKIVPGTRMVIAVSDATQRAAIIKYLSQTK
ncbi:MAG: cytochrome C [Sphingomonadaceae bacterium PASS1]|jgi:cytochrome c|nr:MAG: cytochrome C [Sphingomonadaceae bacterium PASS1]